MNELFKRITIEEFKQYFFRDFSYLPLWDCSKNYLSGDIVYCDCNDTFYQSLINYNTDNPICSDNWEKYPARITDYICDEDIQRAMSQALINANDTFGIDDEEKKNIYLHLVAFYLVMDWKNSSAGAGSSFTGFTASKSVGDVSESYNVPQWLMDNPTYSIYAQNGYGMKYLSLIAPYTSCTILFSPGKTTFG